MDHTQLTVVCNNLTRIPHAKHEIMAVSVLDADSTSKCSHINTGISIASDEIDDLVQDCSYSTAKALELL